VVRGNKRVNCMVVMMIAATNGIFPATNQTDHLVLFLDVIEWLLEEENRVLSTSHNPELDIP
jgi:hypothetical protein